MTVINTLVYGNKFCIIAGDTRRVSNFLGEKLTIQLANVEKKTYQVSPNFIVAAGGSDYLFEPLIKALTKAAPTTVEGVVDTLQTSLDEMKKSRKDFLALQVVGFDEEDGLIYGISVNEDFEVNVARMERGAIGGSIICPGDYTNAMNRTGDLQSFIEDEENILSVLQGFVTYLMKFQFELIEDFPKEISREFCYHILIRDGDKIISRQDKVDI